MVKACLCDGEYWILTCECGVPGCDGVTEPVLSRIFGGVARLRATSPENEPGVHYLAIPVMDYLRDLDMLLATIERGIEEDGITDEAESDFPPFIEFTASAESLQKVKNIRDLIRRKLSGEEIPDFEKRQEPIILSPVEL